VQRLSHQFEDIDQQNESYVVGMWTFLVTEVMFFGALFLAYSVYRVLYFETYLDAHKFLSIPWGTANTLVLLTSSLTMALAVYAAQKGNRTGLVALLSVTVLLSFVFLGIKTIEYSSKIHEGLFPGASFDYAKANRIFAEHHGGSGSHGGGEHGGETPALAQAGMAGEGTGPDVAFNSRPSTGFNELTVPVDSSIAAVEQSAEAAKQETRGRKAQLFFSIYFTMTGLHAVHIIIGIISMSLIAFLAIVRHPSVEDYMPTEMVGLYWHFVDIVWIFLFPLMYLIS
jgi:cytochrome c oxidase subunit 3